MARPKTVLVVDGAEGVRRLIRDVLAPEGYAVLEARSAEEAISLAELHHGSIDLVLTDVDMPLMNGFAFARSLLRKRVGVRILFMSGHSGEHLRRLGLREDGPNFLTKPFAARDMVAKAAALLEAA